MGEVIGEILPVALGVAISPVPIIAVILLLLAPRARAASLAFAAGWVLGVLAVVTAVALLVDPAAGDDDGAAPTWVSVLKIVLGAAAMVLGVLQWRGRPRAGQEPALPSWMAAIDTVTPGRALGLGLVLAAANPKNLTLGLSGGVAIGAGGLPAGETALAIAVFVVVGSSSVALPVVGYLVARERVQGTLDELRQWLTVHNAAVMSVLLLVIGTAILGKGVAGL